MITAVAVLEIHAEMKAEAIIMPSTIWSGRVPTAWMVRRAMRRCRLLRSVASPSTTPPSTRKTTEFA